MMESINLKYSDLSFEESRDLIEFLARKRNVSNYERMTNEKTRKFNTSKTIKNDKTLKKQK